MALNSVASDPVAVAWKVYSDHWRNAHRRYGRPNLRSCHVCQELRHRVTLAIEADPNRRFRALAEFAVRNETAMPRPENFKTAVQALTVRGWPHDQAHELMMAFGRQLDTVNAKVHAAARRIDQDPDRYPHPDAEA